MWKSININKNLIVKETAKAVLFKLPHSSDYDRTHNHVVVIQNYEIVDGKIELYVQDGVDPNVYGKLENSNIFLSASHCNGKNDPKGAVYKFFNDVQDISHIETVKTEVK